MPDKYLFTSARLGFRNWQYTDDLPLAAINADPVVMEFFPEVRDLNDTREFIARMQQLMERKGYCYYAVEKLEDGVFIGFIGLSDQTFAADFTPCTDIGWRLCKNEWNKGYATEGAKRCIEHAFSIPGISKLVAIAPVVNARSERVMRKIGMSKKLTFVHPSLVANERLRECVVYEILAPQWQKGAAAAGSS